MSHTCRHNPEAAQIRHPKYVSRSSERAERAAHFEDPLRTGFKKVGTPGCGWVGLNLGAGSPRDVLRVPPVRAATSRVTQLGP
jgi:hypothetical protein